jgi:hypothetical protein
MPNLDGPTCSNGANDHTVRCDSSTTAHTGLIRTHAVRRLPVIQDDRPVGFVSLGDLAEERDPHSALADIRLRADSGTGYGWRNRGPDSAARGLSGRMKRPNRADAGVGDMIVRRSRRCMV